MHVIVAFRGNYEYVWPVLCIASGAGQNTPGASQTRQFFHTCIQKHVGDYSFSKMRMKQNKLERRENLVRGHAPFLLYGVRKPLY